MWRLLGGEPGTWAGSARYCRGAAHKKGFGEEGILKAGIFLFMALSNLGPQRGKHHSVDKQRVLAVSGLWGPVIVLGVTLALKELPS